MLVVMVDGNKLAAVGVRGREQRSTSALASERAMNSSKMATRNEKEGPSRGEGKRTKALI